MSLDQYFHEALMFACLWKTCC